MFCQTGSEEYCRMRFLRFNYYFSGGDLMDFSIIIFFLRVDEVFELYEQTITAEGVSMIYITLF